MNKRDTYFLSASRSSAAEIAKNQEEIAIVAKNFPFIKNLPVPFVILDKNRQAVFVNKMASEFIALLTGEDSIGKRPGEIFSCANLDFAPSGCGTAAECRNCGAAKALADSQANCKESSSECKIVDDDGLVLEINVAAIPFATTDEQFSVFTFQDVSDKSASGRFEGRFNMVLLNVLNNFIGAAYIESNRENQDVESLMNGLLLESSSIIGHIKSRQELLRIQYDKTPVDLEKLQTGLVLKGLKYQYEEKLQFLNWNISIDENSDFIEFISDDSLLVNAFGFILEGAIDHFPYPSNISLKSVQKGKSILFTVSMGKPIEEQGKEHSDSQLEELPDNMLERMEFYKAFLIITQKLNGLLQFHSDKTRGAIFQVLLTGAADLD
jgi:hypothetical protein